MRILVAIVAVLVSLIPARSFAASSTPHSDSVMIANSVTDTSIVSHDMPLSVDAFLRLRDRTLASTRVTEMDSGALIILGLKDNSQKTTAKTVWDWTGDFEHSFTVLFRPNSDDVLVSMITGYLHISHLTNSKRLLRGSISIKKDGEVILLDSDADVKENFRLCLEHWAEMADNLLLLSDSSSN